MIETAAALADVEAICAVPGLAGVYVGPADLAISMGVDVTKATTDAAVRDSHRRDPPGGDRRGHGAGYPRRKRQGGTCHGGNWVFR